LAEKHTTADLFANQFTIPFRAHATLGALRGYGGNQFVE
jgi:hypothetical protein